jgi:excinuclease ABC subunit C
MDIKKQAAEAPREPGVYIFRDTEKRIIYVGKAAILRNRLSSYFSGKKDIKTSVLLNHADSVETIIVKDEYEALLLENTLIKQHSPKYNIDLKDGKTYPVIRLSAGAFPRVFCTRHIIEDGSAYYGPFPNVGALNDMMEAIDRLFPLRKCRTLSKRNSPCMYYHIERCAAPCCKKITPAAYSLLVDRVRKLLCGDTAALIAELSAEMKEASSALRFEHAAQIRNAIKAIEGLSATSVVVDFDPQSRDYIAWACGGVLATFTVFSMRDGKMTGRDLYRARSAAEEWESLELFITSYYDTARPPPAQIFIQTSGAESAPASAINAGNEALLQNWFKERFGYEPEFLSPTERHHAAIIAMAKQNAEEDLRKRLKERGAGPALDELKTLLSLKDRPEHIEGFDIAQLDGKHPVASLVYFKNGIPDKKQYRRFKLRSVIGVVDDFASMREAVERRYSRVIRENGEPPDLILIDGGIGQVNAAKGILDKLGLDCAVAGLAKREEELWFPNAKQPLKLDRNSEALKVLQFVRDETHRFATSLNQRLRSADLRLHSLESVEGIGSKRAAALLRHYQSIENIAAADSRDIASVCGCGIAAARAVRAAAALAATAKSVRAARGGAKAGAVALAEEAMAAEPTPEYGESG